MAATSWNSADKSANAVIGGTGNLTLSAVVGGSTGARSTNPFSTGKFYFEIIINSTVSTGAVSGIAKGGVAPDLITANPTNGGAVVIWPSGNIWAPNSTGISIGALANGNVLCVAVDIDAKLIWFRKNSGGTWNNSGTADPATGSGGISCSTLPTPYYAFSGTSSGGESSTGNFGATAFIGAVPSGYTAGWGIADPPVESPAMSYVSYVGSMAGASRGRMIRRRKKGETDDIDVDELVKPYVASIRIGRQRYD